MYSHLLLPLLWAITTLATEVVYLCNGQNPYTPGGGPVSEMAFYSNIDNSQNNQDPNDRASVNDRGYVTWEGQAVTGRFSSGVSFTSHIQSGAQGYAVGQYAGYGSNGYHNYNCFRDNGRRVYSPQGRADFYSIYYCKQA